MNGMDILAAHRGRSSAFVYLTWALLRPEDF